MKKLVGIAIVVALCLTFAVSAAADMFVPSVTAKPAPGVDGSLVEVVNGSGSNAVTFDSYKVEIIPVSARDSAYVSSDVKTALTNAYSVLSAYDVKLSSVMPALSNVTAAANVNADNMVVKDLFSVSVSDDIVSVLNAQGNKLKVTFDAKININQYAAVMTSVNGEWRPVEFVVNADGSTTCMLDAAGIVAILVEP